MQLSVIISTYNAASQLQKALTGYLAQSFKDFEIIIADDGSNDETKEVVQSFSGKFRQLRHFWHEDLGFRKCEILNKAIEAASAGYLLFSESDCVPRKDFLQVHMNRREESYFLSGGYFKLTDHLSESINGQDIFNQDCFNVRWLKAQGLKHSIKNHKLSQNKLKTNILNAFATTRRAWNPHNVSCWKKDIIDINGFDERIKYGDEDTELSIRLLNNDIHSINIHFSAICLHLAHSPFYTTAKDIAYNNSILKETRQNNITRTHFGIDKELAITLHTAPENEV